MPQLAEAFGVAVCTIDRALKKERVERRTRSEAQTLVQSPLLVCRECGAGCHPNALRPLCRRCHKGFCESCDDRLPTEWKSRQCSLCRYKRRYKDRPPRLCRVCGRMASRGARRPLCPVHVKNYCKACDQPLPPGRLLLRCRDCEAAKKARLWAKPGRICAMCGENEARQHSCRCQQCMREEYEVRRWAIMHLIRPCVECGADLPKGRRLPRCAKCQRKRMRERNRRRQAIGAHRCAMCKIELSLKHDTYCPGCLGMLAKWRKAWHAGNPVARHLGTVRPNRRWQEAANA
jgi:hypothetical protein